MAQKKQLDPELKRILLCFEKEYLKKNILNLNGLIYQDVVRCTWRHWKEFLSYLQKRGTITQRDVAESRVGSGQSDNLERILNILAVKGKRVADLIDYLYHTQNYSALRVFGIQIEAPPPVRRDIPPAPQIDGEPYNVEEVTGPRQGHKFPPTFKEEPSEYMRVHIGQPIKFEPCHAKRAKRYQWFKALPDGYLLQYESDTCGTYQIPEAKVTDAGTYVCKAFNDAGSASSNNIRVHVLEDQHPQQPSPVITLQPQSVHGIAGEDVVFTCEAVGRGPLIYQWYNSKGEMKGATQSELRWTAHSDDTFICVVMDADGLTAVSKAAKLQIIELSKPATGFTATSKVALLIGNGAYKTNRKLDAVYCDIPRLSHLLRNMGFQVVACYDLTVVEMKKVVTFFASLMMEDVYAFVYVVGHGHYYQGQNYLLAYDAHIDIKPDEDAFLIEWMLKELQQKTPALKAIFLDICRMPPTAFKKTNEAGQSTEATPGHDGDNDEKSHPVMIELPPDKNTIICYATGEFGKSYEVHNNEPESFFVACLMEVLPAREPLEFVGFRMKEIMQKYCRQYHTLQYPVVKSSLAERRSLWDDLMNTGRTKDYQAGISQWESANILPPPLYLNIDRINLQIHLDFEATVTNQFRVIVTIIQNDVSEIPYMAYICHRRIPHGITAKLYARMEDEVVGMKRTVTVFKNLQKLEANLEVHLLLVSGREVNGPVKVDYLLDFGKPMIAQLNLWKPDGDFKRGIEVMKQTHKDEAN